MVPNKKPGQWPGFLLADLLMVGSQLNFQLTCALSMSTAAS